MKTPVCVGLVVLACFSCLAGAATLPFTVQELGADLFRLQYDIGRIDFLDNQELEIDFDPAVYRHVSNAAAPDGFDILLFQPGDPPGAAGRLSALALVARPATAGLISVDVLTTAHLMSGVKKLESEVQDFAINQLDENGVIVSTVTIGQTSPAVPEPGTLGLIGVAMLIVCASPARRRLRKTS